MPKAKFNDIYKDLKKKIEAHAYPYQSLLPSEHELTEVYDCSRNTVRRALRGLIERGYAQAIQGKGVRVLYQTPEQSVCDTVKVPTVIVQNSPSHRGNFPIKSGAP